MSIRRKSTTHDLATLRLHPDGSRVQQSSVNARHRTAGSTLVDARGNWIANDAGGKTSVKTRRSISALDANDAEGEFIDFSDDEHDARRKSKGKQRAREEEEGDLNARSRRRLSFMRDLSFLDPAPVSVSSLEQDAAVVFSDPASDLLKSIHHFASCYYRERGQLLDSSRDYRGMKKERRRQSQNIHTLAANTPKHQNVDSETETEDESTEEDENEFVEAEDSGKEGPKTKGDTYSKDMYKAFDGSALMAIGIVLQEYVAHTLSPRSRTLQEPRSTKRARTG